VQILEILLAQKELISKAKAGRTDLTFKDLHPDILAKARLVLTNEQFEEPRFFLEEQLKEEKATVNKEIKSQ
jgi:hypothetical protein